MLNWLPMVPLITKIPASFPVKSAIYCSKEIVVGSSAKTSSSRVQDWVAASIAAVGDVTVSPIVSKLVWVACNQRSRIVKAMAEECETYS